MGKLEDRVAIITGAASGLGRGMAELFAEERSEVVGTERLDVDLLAARVVGLGEDLPDDGGGLLRLTRLAVDAREHVHQLEALLGDVLEGLGGGLEHRHRILATIARHVEAGRGLVRRRSTVDLDRLGLDRGGVLLRREIDREAQVALGLLEGGVAVIATKRAVVGLETEKWIEEKLGLVIHSKRTEPRTGVHRVRTSVRRFSPWPTVTV